MARSQTAAATPPSPSVASAPARHALIPIEHVRESPLNHRRTWGDMDELVASVKRQGVLQPVLARPAGDGEFELVFGHRRLRAAKKAGLTEIPAMVREMTELEVIEAQVVENVQRQDVHPLEEAEGYEQLLAQKRDPPYTVDEIAAKVGKSKAYVYGRLKLLALCKEARAAFLEGKLTPSVALLVARIPAELQKKALERLRGWEGEPIAFSRAADVVQREFMLRLAEAPFKTADAELVPAAGACTACPKRTGNAPELFAEVKSADVCTDPPCYESKVAAGWARQKVEAEAAGRPVLADKEAKEIFDGYSHRPRYGAGYVDLDEACDRDPKHRTYRRLLGKMAETAVVLARDQQGTPHQLLPRKDVGKLLKAKGHDFKADREDLGPSPDAQWRKQREKERRKRELDEKVAKRVGELFLQRLTTKEPDRAFWIELVERSADFAADGVFERRLGKEKWNDKDLAAAITEMSLAELRAFALYAALSQDFEFDAPEGLVKWAGIDEARVRADVVAGEKAAEKEKPKKGANGKKAAAWTYGVCRECGCTDDAGCPEGCAWTDDTHTLCTSCGGAEDAPRSKPKKTRAVAAPAQETAHG
jgi:ParB/RepB/Spo0J family partition protein